MPIASTVPPPLFTIVVPEGAPCEPAPRRTTPFVSVTVADTVNAGDGVVSLREAILFANSNPGTDTITFNIPGAGMHFIQPTGAALKLLHVVRRNGIEALR